MVTKGFVSIEDRGSSPRGVDIGNPRSEGTVSGGVASEKTTGCGHSVPVQGRGSPAPEYTDGPTRHTSDPDSAPYRTSGSEEVGRRLISVHPRRDLYFESRPGYHRSRTTHERGRTPRVIVRDSSDLFTEL